jgi:predicted site-specific integrase-resolvase
MAALPTYIPIKDAAEYLELPLAVLHDMVDSGKIDAIALPDGEIAVSEKSMEKPQRKEDLPEYKKHAHLKGVGVGINEGAKLYKISYTTLRRWYKKGIVKQLGTEGQKVLLDSADIAYCVEIYKKRGEQQGRRLFNDDGTPYKPKTGPLVAS